VGLLDDFVNALAFLLEVIVGLFEAFTGFISFLQDPDVQADDLSTLFGQFIEQIQPADDVAEQIVDTTEEAVLAPLQQEGELDPQNIEGLTDDVEGNAAALLAGVASAGTAVEALGLGQLDGHNEYILQALAGLGVSEVTGLELDARVQEGVLPALEAKVNADHRAKFADIQDVIEQNLRNKDSDTGFTEDLSTYGIRPEDVSTLEEVALQQIEFEELLETPAELGKVVPEDVLDAELDRAGYAEDTKDFLRETAELLPESARTYQELLRTEEAVGQLDTLAEAGVLEPAEAEALIPEDVEADPQAFRDRFRILRDLPAGAPSGTDFDEDPTIDALLRGQSLDDLAKASLQEEADPGELPARTLSGIGESRGAGLEAAGLETVRDVAQADPQTVVDATQVSPETAEGFITQARQRIT